MDVTERRRAEEGLRLHGEVMSNMAEGVYLIRMSDGIIVYTNPRFEQMFGYESGEMFGKNVSIVNAPTDQAPEETVEEIMDVLLRTGEWHGEVNNIKKDGTSFWCFANVSLFDHPEFGKVLISVHTDISERKFAEEGARDAKRRLEVANAELRAANEELEAFAYSVSHDLRAPPRGIDGFSLALLEDYQDKLDETGRGHLNRVRAGTQRMGALIDDLLKLSRLTRAEMNHKRLDLGELAIRIVNELQKSEHERQVDFEVGAGLTAFGDRALLGAALENLLRNSWKFTSRREHARIELGVTEQNGERVYYVRDDGAGFDMTYVDKLFGAFQRLHGAAEFPGSGIGLAIVQRVIQRHGGRVWAEGEVDKGATFYFTLPATASEHNQSEFES